MFSFYREVTSFTYSNINDRWQETYYFPSTKEMKKMDKLALCLNAQHSINIFISMIYSWPLNNMGVSGTRPT